MIDPIANLWSTEDPSVSTISAYLIDRLRTRNARIGVIGLGYVGLAMANLLAEKGFAVLGFDIDPAKIDALLGQQSYIRHIQPEALWASKQAGRFVATHDPAMLGETDALLICVPTPLDGQRQPDLSFVQGAAGEVARRLRPGTLVVLESTGYPGMCREVVLPILEASGLRSGEDFFLAYSPEREDPGNEEHATSTIPRVVGGDGPIALELVCALYGELVSRVVPVRSIEIAEAVKITENVFRAVNIALINELKTIYDAMGIDIWHVVASASTKPFGYMPFYPGPGLGGHCVPVDPLYLNWKAREHGVRSRFIELAGQINCDMPRRVTECLAREVRNTHSRSLRGARILMIGVAYKRNIDDVRESPGLRLIELLEEAGALVDFYDPFVAQIPEACASEGLRGRMGVPWPQDDGRCYDAALIVSDHDGIDYAGLASACPLVLDTRNACESRGISARSVVKA